MQSLEDDKGVELRRIADTCAAVLQEKSRSADVFAQLVRRADKQRDYKRIDALADSLTQFAPSEICELARSQDVVVRALSSEALAQFPTQVLIGLLSDPVDSEIARDALQAAGGGLWFRRGAANCQRAEPNQYEPGRSVNSRLNRPR